MAHVRLLPLLALLLPLLCCQGDPGAEDVPVQPWLWNSTDVVAFFQTHGLNVTTAQVDRVGVTGQSILDGLVDTSTINKLGLNWDKGVRKILRAIENLRASLPPPKDVREWQQRNRKLAFWLQTTVEPSRLLLLWLRVFCEDEELHAAVVNASGPFTWAQAVFFPSHSAIQLYNRTPFRTLWLDYFILIYLWTKLFFEIAILVVHAKQPNGLLNLAMWVAKDEGQNFVVGVVLHFLLSYVMTPYLFDWAFVLEAFVVLPIFALGRLVLTYQLLFPNSPLAQQMKMQ